jgi:hypothetical protein
MVEGRAFCGVGVVMRWVAALVLAAAASAAAAAAASSTDDLFAQFGLFGTWAVDCKQIASPDNPHVTITTPSPGLILEDHDLGDGNAVNRYSVLSAEKLSANRLAVQVIFQPGKDTEERQQLVWAIHDRTLRTLFNQPQDGPVRVKDGVAVAYGVATPLLKKCE